MALTPTDTQYRSMRTPNPALLPGNFFLPWPGLGQRAQGVPTLPVPFLCPTRSAKLADSDIWAETAWLVLWKQGHRERPEVGATTFHLPPFTLGQRLLTGKGSGGNGLGPSHHPRTRGIMRNPHSTLEKLRHGREGVSPGT